MTRATTKGGTVFGPWTFVAFLVGMGVGLALVAPVLPRTVAEGFYDLLQAGGTVVLVGVLAFALLMVLLAVLYQGYLRA